MTTFDNVKKALTNARELQNYWINEGWQSLQWEEEIVDSKVLDVFPLVEVDISVQITIKLPNKSYSVPLGDVSSISVNDCLVIGVSDLYLDWEERILKNLGEIVLETTITIDNTPWIEVKYLGEDNNFRVVRLKTHTPFIG